MASSTSTRLKLELMADGENDTTWGGKNNTNLEIMEAALAGTTSVATTGGTYVLADVDYTDDEAKRCILDVTGTLSSNAIIEIPNRSKTYKVFNRTTGAYTVSVKTNAGSAIAVTQASSVEVWCDASDTVRFIGPITDFTTGAPNTSSGAAASSVSVVPTGDLTSSNVQSALVELQGDIDTIESDLSSNYQPLDADLTTISGLTATKGNLMAGTGSWGALGVGTDGYTLVADSGEAAGMKWASVMPAGTGQLFYQASAPTGWTAVAQNDKALRVVSAAGTGGTAGGTTAFSTVLADRTITEAQLPVHTHGHGGMTGTAASAGSHTHKQRGSGLCQTDNSGTTNAQKDNNTEDNYSTSSGGAHTHTVTLTGGTTGSTGSGSTIDFAIQYCDVIIATKDAY